MLELVSEFRAASDAGCFQQSMDRWWMKEWREGGERREAERIRGEVDEKRLRRKGAAVLVWRASALHVVKNGGTGLLKRTCGGYQVRGRMNYLLLNE